MSSKSWGSSGAFHRRTNNRITAVKAVELRDADSRRKAGDCWCHKSCWFSNPREGQEVFPKKGHRRTRGGSTHWVRAHFWVGPGSTKRGAGGCVISTRVDEVGEDRGPKKFYEAYLSDLHGYLDASSSMWANIDKFDIEEVELHGRYLGNTPDLTIHHAGISVDRDCTHVIVINNSRHRVLYHGDRTKLNTIVIRVTNWQEDDIDSFFPYGADRFVGAWNRLEEEIADDLKARKRVRFELAERHRSDLLEYMDIDASGMTDVEVNRLHSEHSKEISEEKEKISRMKSVLQQYASDNHGQRDYWGRRKSIADILDLSNQESKEAYDELQKRLKKEEEDYIEEELVPKILRLAELNGVEVETEGLSMDELEDLQREQQGIKAGREKRKERKEKAKRQGILLRLKNLRKRWVGDSLSDQAMRRGLNSFDLSLLGQSPAVNVGDTNTMEFLAVFTEKWKLPLARWGSLLYTWEGEKTSHYDSFTGVRTPGPTMVNWITGYEALRIKNGGGIEAMLLVAEEAIKAIDDYKELQKVKKVKALLKPKFEGIQAPFDDTLSVDELNEQFEDAKRERQQKIAKTRALFEVEVEALKAANAKLQEFRSEYFEKSKELKNRKRDLGSKSKEIEQLIEKITSAMRHCQRENQSHYELGQSEVTGHTIEIHRITVNIEELQRKVERVTEQRGGLLEDYNELALTFHEKTADDLLQGDYDRETVYGDNFPTLDDDSFDYYWSCEVSEDVRKADITHRATVLEGLARIMADANRLVEEHEQENDLSEDEMFDSINSHGEEALKLCEYRDLGILESWNGKFGYLHLAGNPNEKFEFYKWDIRNPTGWPETLDEDAYGIEVVTVRFQKTDKRSRSGMPMATGVEVTKKGVERALRSAPPRVWGPWKEFSQKASDFARSNAVDALDRESVFRLIEKGDANTLRRSRCMASIRGILADYEDWLI